MQIIDTQNFLHASLKLYLGLPYHSSHPIYQINFYCSPSWGFDGAILYINLLSLWLRHTYFHAFDQDILFKFHNMGFAHNSRVKQHRNNYRNLPIRWKKCHHFIFSAHPTIIIFLLLRFYPKISHHFSYMRQSIMLFPKGFSVSVFDVFNSIV